MNNAEIEILKYELQEIYLNIRKIIKKIPPQYDDLFEFKNKSKDDVIINITNEIYYYNKAWILNLKDNDFEIINNILIK